jgi:hypothetical protein
MMARVVDRNTPPGLSVGGPRASSARRVRHAFGAFRSAVIGAVSGVAPHVLHHIGPLAGAAIVSGSVGTAVFGMAGLLLSAPLLWRLRRRSGGWRLPTVALALFTAMFALSTLVIGPAISGDDGLPEPAEADDHDIHH